MVNNYLYNGGSEFNKTSAWYETFYRGYDPVLGRFMQVDPLAGKYGSLTPYNYAFNNPALFNDPMGDDGDDDWTDPMYGRRSRSWVGEFQHITPGSGNHWSDRYRSVDGNFLLMSTNRFREFYGVDQMSAQERADFAQNAGWVQGGDIAEFHEGNPLGVPEGVWTPQTGFIGARESLPILRALAMINYMRHQAIYYGAIANRGPGDPGGKSPYSGHSVALSGGLALGGGVNVSLGIVWNKDGDWKIFASWGPSVGVDASLGLNSKDIITRTGTFNVDQYKGWGSSHNVGFSIFDAVIIGGDNDPQFSTGKMGATYVESGAGLSIGLPAAYTYQMSYTVFPVDWFK